MLCCSYIPSRGVNNAIYRTSNIITGCCLLPFILKAKAVNSRKE